MTALARRIRDALFDQPEADTPLGAWHFRIWEFFIAAHSAYYGWEWGFYVLRNTDVVLSLGMARYIDVSLFFENSAALWNAGAITLLVGIGLARRWRYAYALAMVLLHMQYVTRFSQGEIPHSSNLVGMGLLALALTSIAFRDEVDRRRFAWASTWFFVGLGYTSAAVCKLVATGITWPDGRHLWLWMAEKAVDHLSKTGAFEFNVLQQLAADHWPVATLVLTVGLVTELSGVLMWFPRTRIWIGLGLIGLHLGIGWTMNIFFKSFMVELVIIAFPWARWLRDVVPARLAVKPA